AADIADALRVRGAGCTGVAGFRPWHDEVAQVRLRVSQPGQRFLQPRVPQGAGPPVHAPPVGAEIHRHTYESDLHRGVSLAVFSLQEYPGTPRRLTCAPRSFNIVQGASSRARIL